MKKFLPIALGLIIVGGAAFFFNQKDHGRVPQSVASGIPSAEPSDYPDSEPSAYPSADPTARPSGYPVHAEESNSE
jgi:hypothetical protein